MVDTHPETGRPETDAERVDRNLLELLNELRVALPGVQVLFAFLLIVPFSQGYTNISEFQKDVYFVTLLCTGVSAVLLIAPSIQHRIEFRRQDKEHIVRVANSMAVAGLSFLAVAMVGVVMLVTNVLFDTAATVLTTILFTALFAVLWYALPLRRLAQRAGDR